MADNFVKHVIKEWAIFQKFRSHLQKQVPYWTAENIRRQGTKLVAAAWHTEFVQPQHLNAKNYYSVERIKCIKRTYRDKYV